MALRHEDRSARARRRQALQESAGILVRVRGHCLQLGFESLPLLIDLQPPPGSLWIQSGGAPIGNYDPALPVLQSWVARFGLELRTVFSTGHSRPEDIVRMVSTVRPKLVLPVHSTAPERLVVPGVPSFLPRAGVTYTVSDILVGVSSAPSD